MSMSAIFHDANRAYLDFDSFGADETCGGPTFGSLKIDRYYPGFKISIMFHKDSQSLLFLDQLRAAVDEAIKWARG